MASTSISTLFLLESLYEYLPTYSKCIVDFDDFLKYFILFFQKFGAMSPITKGGYIMMPSTPNSISGLILDLDFASHSSDSAKEAFFSEENKCQLEGFMNLAHRNGFLLDKNAPWRLVFNTMPVPGTDVADEFGKDFLEKYYFKAFNEDAHNVMRFVHNSYHLFFKKNPHIFIEKEDRSGRLIKGVFKRETNSNYLLGRPRGFWLDLVLRVRSYELTPDVDYANMMIDEFYIIIIIALK